MLLAVNERVISSHEPPEVLVNTFVYFVSVSFFMFPYSKGHPVRAYLEHLNDLRENELSCFVLHGQMELVVVTQRLKSQQSV